MKEDTQDRLPVGPGEQREILDQIRNDHELIERLKITPEELEALSKCSMFGTLTCKQDMLFILRQIRQPSGRPAAGGPMDETTLLPQPAAAEDQEEDPIPPDLRRVVVPLAGNAVSEPGPLKSTVRRRISKQFTILFWTVVLILGLAWNFLIAMLRWGNNFMTSIATPAAQAAHSAAWYGNLDRTKILLWGEVLIVVGIALVMYRKPRKGNPRLKVRPRRTWP
jgi:hypothetical protein